ncbi:MAG: serine/threonine protein kinase, partial [Thermoleophilaceae bacterium]
KLADLGIASAMERNSRITRTGTVLGTAAYIAPERLDGGVGGPPSDVYALAAVAYEALSGHKAVEGSTPVEVARRVISGPPPDLTRHWPDAPPEAVAALQRGMAREPRDRPRSAGEFVAELGGALALGRTRPTTPLRPVRPPPSSAALLAALVAMAAVAIAVVLFAIGGGSENKSASTATKKPKPATAHRTAAAPAPLASDPAKVVSDFYKSSIGGNIDHAWSISTDGLHQQVGGRQSLQGQESTLTSIDFTQLNTVSKTASAATVAFADDAHHQGFTDHCTGTASLVPGGPQGWLLDRISVQCGRSSGAAPPPSATPPGQAKKQPGKGAKPKHSDGGGKGGD